MAEGDIHVTVAVIMHFASGREKSTATTCEKRLVRPCPDQQSSAIRQTNNFSLRGTVVLGENLWSVSLVVGLLDDWDALRGSRNIVRSPRVSFRRVSSETRCTTSAPVFEGKLHGSFSLDARRLPADHPPHFQHQSVASRNNNWCER